MENYEFGFKYLMVFGLCSITFMIFGALELLRKKVKKLGKTNER